MKEETSNDFQIGNARYIKCPDCGQEIMMVPVLGQMIEAIEAHLATHTDYQNSPEHCLPTPKLKSPQIEDNLAEQVLTRAAEIGDALGKNPVWINRQ